VRRAGHEQKKKHACPQRLATTTEYFQPPVVAVRGLTLAQSVPTIIVANKGRLEERNRAY